MADEERDVLGSQGAGCLQSGSRFSHSKSRTLRQYQVRQNAQRPAQIWLRESTQSNQCSSLLFNSTNFKLTVSTLRCRAKLGSQAKGTEISEISSVFSRNLASAQRGKTHVQITVTWSVQNKARPVGRGASPAGGNKLEGQRCQRERHPRERREEAEDEEPNVVTTEWVW